MNREQRNVLAELIVAALHDERDAAALRSLARTAAGDARVAASDAARLAAAGLVVHAHDRMDGEGGEVDVTLAPLFVAVRGEVIERVRRALAASDAYWGPRRRTTPSPPSSQPAPDLAGTLHRSAALFDARLYFEVHEELEALWLLVRGETRLVVQGLLQIAVALHHAEQGNLAGARRLLAAGRAKIAPHAPVWHGVAIATLLAELEQFEAARLGRGDPARAPRLIVAT